MNGGCYTPPNCVPRQRVAILIPYKDREAHLYSLLNYLHPMLQRQQIQYCVFIIEQVDDGRFNKGLVMNSGFKVSSLPINFEAPKVCSELNKIF